MSETQFIKSPSQLFRYNRNNSNGSILMSVVIGVLCIFAYLFSTDFRIIFSRLADAIYMGSSENRYALFECLKNNIGILIGPLLLCIIIFYATTDPNALFSNISSYAIAIIVIVIGSFVLFSSLLNFSNSSYMMFLIGGIILFSISMVGYFSSYITPGVINYVGNVMKIFILLMIIVGLAIGYKIFSERIKALTGWKGFFANFLFFIPCLLSDSLEYLLQQYKITPNIIFILLLIELLLLLGYIFIPKLISKSVNKTSIMLQNKPVYLNKELQVGNVEQFLYKPLDDKIIYTTNDAAKYRTNYCISMWVFINIQSSSDSAYANETTIFDYNSHPRITYKNQTKNSREKQRDVYTFYFSNTSNNANYEVSIPNQKWNFISINYFESKADLYINGNLERTYSFSNDMPEYASSDLIKLGSQNGLNGAICNVTYNKKPLKNPPVDIFTQNEK